MSKELMQLVLDALEEAQAYTSCESFSPSMTSECTKVAEALRTALAQPEPEPVASVTVSHYKGLPNRDMDYWGNLTDGTYRLYTAPPEKEWVGLTDEELEQGLLRSRWAVQTALAWRDGVEWAAKQLKEKNT